MKTPKECRATRREIDEALTGQQLVGRALAHMAVCAPCRKFHDQHVRLAELVGSLQPVTAPADFDIRLRARLIRESKDRTSWFTLPSFAFGKPVTVAAAVVILAGAVVLLNRFGVIQRGSVPVQVTSHLPQSKKIDQPSAPAIAENEIGSAVTSPATGNNNQRIAADKIGQPKDPRSNGSMKRRVVRSDDFALSPAPSIRRNGVEQNAGDITVNTPFEFSLQDSQGVTRKFSLPPVSFGSQQLVQRGRPYQSASYSGNRIW